jgi:hypothetical protein
MSKGVLFIARNNKEINYLYQAVFNAHRVHKYLGVPVSIITDNKEYLETRFDSHPFEHVIEIPNDQDYGYRKYNDGTYSKRNLEWKNTSRAKAYDLSPYEETLLLDTDYIIANSLLKDCFNQLHDFLIYKDSVELSGWRDVSEFKLCSDKTIDFYWATCVYFRKSPDNKRFFDLLHHISENWEHYRNLYQIKSAIFRNDYVFSVAIHIMNGHYKNGFAKTLPGKLFYTIDRDLLIDIDGDDFLFCIEKKDSFGNYMPLRMRGSNVHVMNKFSLTRAMYVPEFKD